VNAEAARDYPIVQLLRRLTAYSQYIYLILSPAGLLSPSLVFLIDFSQKSVPCQVRGCCILYLLNVKLRWHGLNFSYVRTLRWKAVVGILLVLVQSFVRRRDIETYQQRRQSQGNSSEKWISSGFEAEPLAGTMITV